MAANYRIDLRLRLRLDLRVECHLQEERRDRRSRLGPQVRPCYGSEALWRTDCVCAAAVDAAGRPLDVAYFLRVETLLQQ